MTNHKPWVVPKRTRTFCPLSSVRLTTLVGALIMCGTVEAQEESPIAGLLSNQPGLNTTQTNMAIQIENACPGNPPLAFNNEPEFQARCNAVVGAALQGQTSEVVNSLDRVSPEQIIGPNTEATKTSNIQASNIGARLLELRAGVRGISLAGLELDGKPVFAGLMPLETGGAAGEGTELWSRLGAFINGAYHFGEVDSTFNQLGFDFDSGGVTAGVDYRLTDNLVLGAAFNYVGTGSDFDQAGGELDSDSYSGSVYGTFYATESFYIDGIVSYRGIDYESTRNIPYNISPNLLAPGGDPVNTQATADPDGEQFSVNAGGGYDLALGALTVGPYAHVSYINLDIDAFSEQGGLGWGMRFPDQEIDSVTTTLGAQLSYAVSTPFGVLLPHVRGEWHHEFEDDSRNIAVRFLGDTTSGLPFNIVTEDPDRNYYNFGAGVSGTFARGISAFLAMMSYSAMRISIVTGL
jgi:outer membrane lipase/esterase